MNNFKNRGISSCLSFLLVLMILTSALGSGFTPTIASASEPAGEATISIVFGLGFGDVADVALNKTYAYSAGATVEDLFDLAVAAGDLEGFLLDAGGFPKSITRAGGITFENAANMSTFWSTYVDGTYYAGGDNLQTLLLEDGKAYQFAWESWPTAVAPDWTTLGAPDEGDGVVGGAPAAGSATLAIVYGIGDGFLGPIGQPLVVTNVVYDFTAGATLEDMLDHAVDEWDIDDYALNSYGYLDSVSFWFFMNATNAVDFKTYWSLYVDGDYYAGADTIGTLVLENGRSYQFAWESYPIAAAPDWSALGAPDTANDPDNGGLANPPAPFSQATFNKIFSNIAAQFVGTGEDWKALEMAAIGKEGAVNKNAIIANAVSAFNSPDTTNLQRSILALTALGIDPANVTNAGTTYDLIDKLSKSAISHNTTNGQMFALLAYTSGPYTPPAG
ncbi:MAG: hypothetical protein FWE87_01940, partial [Coriobacteriia bacterium]|nr:hypothetical protein [Coriobacteriia bacterium]